MFFMNFISCTWKHEIYFMRYILCICIAKGFSKRPYSWYSLTVWHTGNRILNGWNKRLKNPILLIHWLQIPSTIYIQPNGLKRPLSFHIWPPKTRNPMPLWAVWGKWFTSRILGFTGPTVPKIAHHQVIGVFTVQYWQMACQVPDKPKLLNSHWYAIHCHFLPWLE